MDVKLNWVKKKKKKKETKRMEEEEGMSRLIILH